MFKKKKKGKAHLSFQLRCLIWILYLIIKLKDTDLFGLQTIDVPHRPLQNHCMTPAGSHHCLKIEQRSFRNQESDKEKDGMDKKRGGCTGKMSIYVYTYLKATCKLHISKQKLCV